MTSVFPELRAGGLRISPPLLLAPMAGVTHTAFRRLLAELGGVGLYATEMLSARSLPAEDRQASPYLKRTAAEAPLSHQVLVARPEEVGPAFEVLHALGADAIDLNLGCPAPEARRRGAGSALAAQPAAARGVVQEARRRTALPLTRFRHHFGPHRQERLIWRGALLDFVSCLVPRHAQKVIA